MTEVYSKHISRVDQLIADAFALMEFSKLDTSESQRKRAARASIIHSSLVIESLANNCLRAFPLPKRLYDSLEQMATFEKLELFSWQVAKGEPLDKGRRETQAISELISLRNAYVHPKIRKENVEDWPHLRIPKNADKWRYADAERVFHAVIEFLQYFLVELCGLTGTQRSHLVRSYMESVDGKRWRIARTDDDEVFDRIAEFLKSELQFLGEC